MATSGSKILFSFHQTLMQRSAEVLLCLQMRSNPKKSVHDLWAVAQHSSNGHGIGTDLKMNIYLFGFHRNLNWRLVHPGPLRPEMRN